MTAAGWLPGTMKGVWPVTAAGPEPARENRCREPQEVAGQGPAAAGAAAVAVGEGADDGVLQVADAWHRKGSGQVRAHCVDRGLVPDIASLMKKSSASGMTPATYAAAIQECRGCAPYCAVRYSSASW
jgi:hypothetical protein